MHERLDKGLKNCLIANIMFFVFGLICFVYYKTYVNGSVLSKIIEFLAYACEICGFMLFLWGDWLISTAIRFRNTLKASLTAYIFLEALMMVFEINSNKLDFYEPYSLLLAIVHSIISGLTCLTFLQLETDKKPLERMVLVCIAMMFAGMLGNIIGIRIYFSIIINAVAFAVLFYSVRRLIAREEIEVDCHGDKARVAEFKSTFVDD